MKLTADQRKALESGAAVPVTIDNAEFIVIRRDVYDKVQRRNDEDSDLTEAEREAITDQTLDDLDTAGPIE